MASVSRLRINTNQDDRRVDARGNRTGVNILSQNVRVQDDGFENMEAFFSHVRSPEMKENPAVPPKFTRFSVGSTQKDDSSTSTAGRTQRMMERVKGLRSPSDLSRVSKAPASPEPVVQQQRRRASREQSVESSPPPILPDDSEEEEEKEPAQPPSVEEESEDEEPTQQIRVDEEDDDKEEEPHPQEQEQQDDSQTLTEASVVEDDFMPPGPPDSPERDDESESLSQQDDPVGIKTQSTVEEDEESVGDGDETSPGYAMPTTKIPQSAEALRKGEKVRKQKSEKKKKSSKKRKKSDEEEQVQEKKKKKKTKQTPNRYVTVFSPKGIPLPLEYETVPVANQREPKADVTINGKKYRRSTRTRCPPLAYWKNEKLEYGPNDDSDANSDVAKMPVPKAIIRAKETPYKPRVVRQRVVTASNKKKSKSATIVPEEAPPAKFDRSRLPKKYKYTDKEEFDAWDDIEEDLKETSEYSLRYN